MNLSEDRAQTIRAWAECNPYILQVRLFGSRAKGTARPGSDADLAVTIVGTEAETPLGIFVGEKSAWEERLSVVTWIENSSGAL